VLTQAFLDQFTRGIFQMKIVIRAHPGELGFFRFA
jgi:hypothetical protein